MSCAATHQLLGSCRVLPALPVRTARSCWRHRTRTAGELGSCKHQRQLQTTSDAKLVQGTVLTYSRTFTASDVQSFASVSGDHNPIHLSDEFASTTAFKRTIVHGMLTASMFSTLFAANLPGAVYLSQELRFLAPVCLPRRTYLVETWSRRGRQIRGKEGECTP